MLVRKIKRNHWPNSDIDTSDIKADAITQCLRTSQNALSVYEISSLANMDEAFLAIASNSQYLETFEVVTLEKKELLDVGMDCIQTTGRTPVESLKDTHNDIPNLCYSKLGVMARYTSERINNGHIYRRIRGQIKEILIKAIKEDILTFSTLDEKLQEKLSEP